MTLLFRPQDGQITGTGALSVSGVADYETLVTDDDDIPNKKYVDDAITGSAGLANVVEDLSPQLGANLNVNEFRIVNGSASLDLEDDAATLFQSANGTTGQQLSIFAGEGTAGIGGGLTLIGGEGTTSGGKVTIDGGRGTSGPGGDIELTPGRGSTTTNGGNILIDSPALSTVAPLLGFSEAAANGTTTLFFKAPDSVTTTRTWVLPEDDPAVVFGQFLTTDASGVLSFAAVAAHPDPHLLADGSSSAPSYSFASDTDLGVYRHASDTLGLAADVIMCQASSNSTTDYVLKIRNSADNYAAEYGAYGMTNRVYGATTVDYTLDIGGELNINVSGVQRARFQDSASTLEMFGTANDVTAATYVSFRYADGTRIGYVGDGSNSTDHITLNADLGDVRVTSISDDVRLTAGAKIECFVNDTLNALNIEANGTLTVAGTTNYEALVIDDDDIPNKKYVDDLFNSAAQKVVFEYTATASQTTFTGADDNALVLAYTPGSIFVFLNGVLLQDADYTATNGTSVVLTIGATLDDLLTVVAFEVAPLVSASLVKFEYTATASQTTFSGVDDNTSLLSYTVGSLDVFQNGVQLLPSQYTASNGTSVVLDTGASVDDTIAINAYQGDINPSPAPEENVIINGDFRVAQRGTSFTGLTTGNFVTLDRWRFASAGGGVVTVTQNTATGSDVPFDSYINVDVTTADATLTGTENYVVFTHIEGYDASHLNFGESNASDVTLSFWHSHTVTGTFCASLRNGAGDRSYVIEYTQSVANTWEKTEVTIPGDVTGTWLTTNGVGVTLFFTIAAASSFEATVNTWTAGNKVITSNQVNGVGTIGNDFRIGNVKLEKGSVATDFVPRPIGAELALCQRYFEKSYNPGVAPGTVTTQGSWTNFRTTSSGVFGGVIVVVPFKVRKRGAATVTLYSNGGTGASGNVRVNGTSDSTLFALDATSRNVMRIWNGGAIASDGDYFEYQWTADAEL